LTTFKYKAESPLQAEIFRLLVLIGPGQLSLAIPPWVDAISTSKSREANRHAV